MRWRGQSAQRRPAVTTTETYRRSSNVIIGKTATSPPSDLRHGPHALASIRREADAYNCTECVRLQKHWEALRSAKSSA
jgi:hypothetical protein